MTPKNIARQYIPDSCIERRKQGFGIPINRWLDNELTEHVHELTSENLLSAFHIIDRTKLKQKLLQKEIGYNQIWTLIILNAWLNVWF